MYTYIYLDLVVKAIEKCRFMICRMGRFEIPPSYFPWRTIVDSKA